MYQTQEELNTVFDGQCRLLVMVQSILFVRLGLDHGCNCVIRRCFGKHDHRLLVESDHHEWKVGLINFMLGCSVGKIQR